MAPYFSKPENALKRAEELIAVGQNNAALQTLHDVITSKRSRSVPLASLEPIVMRYVELCVDDRKGKFVKEGLHQYKNVAQNTSVGTIELVIKHFIELSEAKVTEAQQKADRITLDDMDDLEASETPESVLLSTVSGEQSKDRTDRAVVTPWLKFLWESYRTVLDILRNNARLEILYQEIANQAFQFCLKYKRKTEFRRLCDLLRNHLSNIAKYSHQSHSINLNDPESLQRHLDTRFNQLSAAVELELWQEAYRSVEDIFNLLSMSKRPPKPAMMANYYEKLTRIFMVSENYLFHAASWNRYFSIVRSQRMAAESEISRMASTVLLSALAIPVITTSKIRPGYVEADEQKSNKNQRLAALLGMGTAPSRSHLLKEALNKNILRLVRPELRDLYNILEVQFHPLSICKKIKPILAILAEDKDFVKYVQPLHQVILTRLLQQLSQVYTTIKLGTVIELANFPEPYNYDAATIEKFIMNGCKKGELSIRIDHATQSLTFETDLFAPFKGSIAEGPKLQSSPSDLMRSQLVHLGTSLATSLNIIDGGLESHEEAKKKAFAKALASAEEEHKATLARKAIIERRKEHIETLLMRKEKEEARERALKQQQELEAERIRLAEESKKRELERIRREHEAIQREEARKLADALKQKSKLKLDEKELATADTETLVKLQVEQIEKEKRELNDRLKSIAKRMDHIERAYRKEEIPLLEKDYERQRKADRAYHEAAKKAKQEAAAQRHAEDLAIKKRMMRMIPDYETYRKEVEEKRHEEFEAKRRAAEHKIEEEKAKRLQAYRARKAEVEAQREAQEKARLEREKAAREAEEEASRKAEEKRAAFERERAAREESRRQAEEQAERQRQRELEAERRLEERRAARRAPAPASPSVNTPTPSRWVPPAQRAPAQLDEMAERQRQRELEAERRAEERRAARRNESRTETPPPNRWVPPHQRQDGAGAENRNRWTPSSRSESSSPATPSSAPGGGWRAREAARRAAEEEQQQ